MSYRLYYVVDGVEFGPPGRIRLGKVWHHEDSKGIDLKIDRTLMVLPKGFYSIRPIDEKEHGAWKPKFLFPIDDG